MQILINEKKVHTQNIENTCPNTWKVENSL